MTSRDFTADAPEGNEQLFMELLSALHSLKVSKACVVGAPKQDVEHIANVAEALRLRLSRLVMPVSHVLFYAQDTDDVDKDHSLHWITYSLGSFIEDLNGLISVCKGAMQDQRWLSSSEVLAQSQSASCFVAVPYSSSRGWSYHPTNNTMIPGADCDLDMLSYLDKSIAQTMELEACHLTGFSSALRVAHATREVDSSISGALMFISEWSGLIEKLGWIRDDVQYKLECCRKSAA